MNTAAHGRARRRRAGDLAVTEYGDADAPAAVLVHGSMDRASSFRGTARRLEPAFRVVTYDRRGYGGSRPSRGPYGVADQVDDLLAVIGDSPSLVFGHSLGGDIALAAAQRHPTLITAVGAYEPPMSWEPWWPSDTAGGEVMRRHREEGPAAAAEAFLRLMVGEERWDRMPPSVRDERRAEGEALVGEMAAMRQAPPFDLGLLEVPILFARGERAAGQHVHAATVAAARLRDAARSVPAEVVIVPGADHGIHLRDPDALADLVRRLDALRAASR